MASLKRNISLILAPSLFLSSSLLIRLKSPTIIQSTSGGICISLNHSRKILLPAGVQGAYTVVRSQLSIFSLEVNSTEMAKELLKTICPRNADPCQATRIPPEAPTEGIYSKESKFGGQMFLMKVASKFSFFVS